MAQENGKRAVGIAAAQLVQSGQIVGLGTGTTAAHFVAALAARAVEEGLAIRCVATSLGAAQMATQAGLTVVPLAPDTCPDITIDGADEVDPALNLIKGGGGAHIREKIVAANSKEMVVIADASKEVEYLGAFPLPIAVTPFGWEVTQARIESAFGIAAPIRGGAVPFVTDDGFYLLDARFGRIDEPHRLAATLSDIAGVVDTGLFVGIATRVLIGHLDGTVTERRR